MNEGEAPKKRVSEEYPILLMKTGYLQVGLLFAAVVALLAVAHYTEAMCFGAVAVLSLLVRHLCEKGQCDRLGCTAERLLTAEACVLEGEKYKNGLLVPSFIRVMPIAVAVIGAAVAAIWGFAEGREAADTIATAAVCIASGASVGVAPVIGAGINAGITGLRQRNIDFSELEKFGEISCCDTLAADKSLFYGTKGAEIREFYVDGELKKITELKMIDHLPLVTGFYMCDDGSFGSACGIRGSIGESLMRQLRASPDDQKRFSRIHLIERTPYSDERGYASATYSSLDGVLSSTVGIPEAILPLTERICRGGIIQDLTEADRKRIVSLLRREYQNGRRAAMLAAGLPDEGGLALVGFIFLATSLSTESAMALSELSAAGIRTVLVSDMNEESAFAEAKSIGAAWDISQVITGPRLDNFREESIRRAIPSLRLAAEMGQRHRPVLISELEQSGRRVIAASRDSEDSLLSTDSAINISGGEGGRACDGVIRQCKVSDIATTVRISRTIYSSVLRAVAAMLAFPTAVALFLTMSVSAGVGLMLPAPAIALIMGILPLCQGFFIAIPAKELNPSISPSVTKRTASDGSGYLLWSAIVPFYAAIASMIVCQSAGESSVEAGGCAAFLTMVLILLVSGLVSKVWGGSLFKTDNYGGRGILVLTFLVMALFVFLTRLSGFNSLMGFEAFDYEVYLSVGLFAVMPAVVYQAAVSGAAIRRGKNRGN